MEPTRCLIITRRALESAMAVDQEVVWMLLRRMAERVRVLVDRMDGLALHSARARLATMLAHSHAEADLCATG
jgi:hypothetical protein